MNFNRASTAARGIADSVNQVSLAIWVAVLVILSTLGFIGLGAKYVLLEQQNTALLNKNDTYIILEKLVIAMEGRLAILSAETNSGAALDVMSAVHEVSEQAGELQSKIDDFLSDVAAA